MNDDINIFYHNHLGIAFQWKRCDANDHKKIQLVFRDTGLLLDRKELELFSKHIEEAKNARPLCIDCKQNENCRALLLETPFPQLSFAVGHKELAAIGDLVNGTLFHLQLNNYLNGIL